MSEVLRVEHIMKRFPGVLAVNDVSFSLDKGEVLALLGENGAGKSTITKIICGAQKPDSGALYIEGENVQFESAREAMNKGVGMVYQELSMVGNMSVAENIFMNRQPVNALGNVQWKKLYEDTTRLLEKFDIQVDPRTLVKNLSVGTQQLLEILKAISLQPKVLILDEPTSSLAEKEVELMFNTIRTLQKEGYSFIYISHKLSEIFEISDKVVVMRDGCYVDCRQTATLNENDIIKMMVGREIEDIYGRRQQPLAEEEGYGFEVRGLTAAGLYEDVSFGVRRGEILGISGLIGAGRTEMALGIVGAHQKDKGELLLHGQPLSIHDPRGAINNKIAYLTEDRKKLGLYLTSPIKDNIVAPMLGHFARGGRMQDAEIQQYAKTQVEKYGISTPSVEQKVGNLSGGNQQKCLISMWMGTQPDVLIFDEPTRGVDVGAKSEIYRIVREFAAEGKCVILISSELPELLGISDRIMVMCRGRISGEVERENFNEERIMEYATGVRQTQS